MFTLKGKYNEMTVIYFLNLFFPLTDNTSSDIKFISDQISEAILKQNTIMQCQLDNLRELRIEISLFREDLHKLQAFFNLTIQRLNNLHEYVYKLVPRNF